MSISEHEHTTEEEAHACDGEAPEIMERTLRLIGDKWTLMIVYNLINGEKRFGQLLDALGGVSPKTLSQRLKQLEQIQLVERRAFAEIPPRVEYLLTEKGRALVDILKAIREFGAHCLSDIPDPSLKSYQE